MEHPKVLVADSERDVADTLADLLASNGLAVRTAYDGRQALDVASTWIPDGAVIELSLPKASGYEVAESLRNKLGRRVRLIAFTSWTPLAIRRRALRAGFDGVMAKPSMPDRILEIMSREAMLLVKRPTAVIVRRLGLLLELAASLPEAWDRQSRVDAAAVNRIVDFVRLELRNSTIPSTDRIELRRRMTALKSRARKPPPS